MNSKAFVFVVVFSFFLAIFVPQILAQTWQEFAVSGSDNDQYYPDIDGGIVVWQEDFTADGYGWDICGSDVSDPSVESFFYVAADADDQIEPSISGNIVAFSAFVETDYDIWASDITDTENVSVFAISQLIDINEQSPAVHGNTVVWQDNRFEDTSGPSDIDIIGADIYDRESITTFLVTPYVYDGQTGHDQQYPAIWRNKVVCETTYFGDSDIMFSDIWLRDNPDELPVFYGEYTQINPAISGDMVVWQGDDQGDMDIYAADISNSDQPEIYIVGYGENPQENPDIDGNIIVWQEEVEYGGVRDWDIHGYNFTTGQEFVICNNEYDQMNPVISGNIVAWEDNRSGVWQIYAMILGGAEVAGCDVKQAGDLNADCIVDMYDLAILSSNWLRDELIISD